MYNIGKDYWLSSPDDDGYETLEIVGDDGKLGGVSYDHIRNLRPVAYIPMKNLELNDNILSIKE